MNKVIYELGNKIIEPPVNQREVEIELNFDTDDPSAQGTVTVNTWDFSKGKGGADIIRKHILDGLTGGVGIYEGIPFKVSVEDDTSRLNVLDGFIDMTGTEVDFECDRYAGANSKIRGGIDWLNDQADITLYNILFSNGTITTADYVSLPYVISSIPDTQSMAMLTLSIFVIINEIRRTIKDMIDLGIEVGGVFTTLPAIAKLVFFIVYLVILIISLVKLIKDLIDVIIQPVKYHTGMKLITLLEKGAEHLGMTFESSIFEEDEFWKSVVILPAKFQSFPLDSEKGKFGMTRPKPEIQTGYYEGSFGDILRICKTIFNAKILASDGVIKLERVDKNTSVENYKLPNVEQEVYGTNASEINSTYNIRFAVDQTETNTIDNYEGTVTNVVTQPKAINNKDMVLLKGLRREEIPFSRGNRKTKYTAPEEFFLIITKAFGSIIDKLIKNAPSIVKRRIPPGGVSNLISNRLGMLSLSQDYFTSSKIIGCSLTGNPVSNKVSTENANKINSEYLYDNFHYVNSFVPTTERPNAKQEVIYTARIPFCKEDFEKVTNNNIIFTFTGEVSTLQSLKWNTYHNFADVRYRVPQLLTSNLKETKNTPYGL